MTALLLADGEMLQLEKKRARSSAGSVAAALFLERKKLFSHA
jgi:hypothetical protein